MGLDLQHQRHPGRQHQEGIAADETLTFFTRLMVDSGAMLWGRVTFEMMESYWQPLPPATRRHHRRRASGRSSGGKAEVCDVLDAEGLPEDH